MQRIQDMKQTSRDHDFRLWVTRCSELVGARCTSGSEWPIGSGNRCTGGGNNNKSAHCRAARNNASELMRTWKETPDPNPCMFDWYDYLFLCEALLIMIVVFAVAMYAYSKFLKYLYRRRERSRMRRVQSTRSTSTAEYSANSLDDSFANIDIDNPSEWDDGFLAGLAAAGVSDNADGHSMVETFLLETNPDALTCLGIVEPILGADATNAINRKRKQAWQADDSGGDLSLSLFRCDDDAILNLEAGCEKETKAGAEEEERPTHTPKDTVCQPASSLYSVDVSTKDTTNSDNNEGSDDKDCCYVCLMPCDTRGTCACKALVHASCLARVRDLTKCSICRKEYAFGVNADGAR